MTKIYQLEIGTLFSILSMRCSICFMHSSILSLISFCRRSNYFVVVSFSSCVLSSSCQDVSSRVLSLAILSRLFLVASNSLGDALEKETLFIVMIRPVLVFTNTTTLVLLYLAERIALIWVEISNAVGYLGTLLNNSIIYSPV